MITTFPAGGHAPAARRDTLRRTRRRFGGVALLAVLGLYGCQTTRIAAPEAPPRLDVAQKAEHAGQYVLAAHEYQRLARRTRATRKQVFQLRALDALIRAGQLREAHELAETIKITRRDPDLVARRRVLQARLLSMEGEQGQAIRLLDRASRVRRLRPALYAEIYGTRAQIEMSLDDPISAVKDLMAREHYIVDPRAIAENQAQLWKILNTISRARINAELAVTRDPVLAGWLELARAAADNVNNPAGLAAAVARWRASHPHHPAGAALLATLTQASPAWIGRVQRIALLLPLTSDYSLAAQAVRDGFMAMASLNRDPDKPNIRVYDIGANPSQAPAFYAQAVTDGAQMIVGPLGREAADNVVRQTTITVPTLLLTRLDANAGSPSPDVFQFGLSPGEEARQVAARAYLDGHRKAAVLYPQNPWGQRLLDAFTAAWESLGGIVVASQPYDEAGTDFSAPVKQLLDISESEERRDRLQLLLGTKLRFEPRPRQDIDCIFLAADAARGRLIKPQLNFYRAEHVPVYATSLIFSGKDDPIRDRDLDGIEFGDMPWMLIDSGKIEALRQKLQAGWPYAHTDLDRLYALGMDSYAIIPQLDRIRADSTARVNGVTSELRLDRHGQIHRQLLWAQFRQGVPQLLDTFLHYGNQLDVGGLGHPVAQTTSRP